MKPATSPTAAAPAVAPYSDVEIDAFVRAITGALARKAGKVFARVAQIDEFCDSIQSLLDEADARRESKPECVGER